MHRLPHLAPTMLSRVQHCGDVMHLLPQATWPAGQPAGVVNVSVLLIRLGLSSALKATVDTV